MQHRTQLSPKRLMAQRMMVDHINNDGFIINVTTDSAVTEAVVATCAHPGNMIIEKNLSSFVPLIH